VITKIIIDIWFHYKFSDDELQFSNNPLKKTNCSCKRVFKIDNQKLLDYLYQNFLNANNFEIIKVCILGFCKLLKNNMVVFRTKQILSRLLVYYFEFIERINENYYLKEQTRIVEYILEILCIFFYYFYRMYKTKKDVRIELTFKAFVEGITLIHVQNDAINLKSTTLRLVKHVFWMFKNEHHQELTYLRLTIIILENLQLYLNYNIVKFFIQFLSKLECLSSSRNHLRYLKHLIENIQRNVKIKKKFWKDIKTKLTTTIKRYETKLMKLKINKYNKDSYKMFIKFKGKERSHLAILIYPR